jgi:hypothetical protein
VARHAEVLETFEAIQQRATSVGAVVQSIATA